ncbi:hypothetical protein ACFLT9_00695 [Acidobacteriota bacterium]
MVKSELIKRSPLRILEKSIDGGLQKGNIAILASRKGVGKTASLVHIATDRLFQNKPVIHVSYSGRVDYIMNWYEDIFKEIAKKRNLEHALEVHDEIIRNRVIMNFKQDGQETGKVLENLKAIIEHGNFPAETIIVDGYDFSKSNPDDFAKFRAFAMDVKAEVWFSATLKGDEPIFDGDGYPFLLKEFDKGIDVLITLAFTEDHVKLNLVKNHDKPAKGVLPIRFDPKTMLIAE